MNYAFLQTLVALLNDGVTTITEILNRKNYNEHHPNVRPLKVTVEINMMPTKYIVKIA